MMRQSQIRGGGVAVNCAHGDPTLLESEPRGATPETETGGQEALLHGNSFGHHKSILGFGRQRGARASHMASLGEVQRT